MVFRKGFSQAPSVTGSFTTLDTDSVAALFRAVLAEMAKIRDFNAPQDLFSGWTPRSQTGPCRATPYPAP